MTSATIRLHGGWKVFLRRGSGALYRWHHARPSAHFFLSPAGSRFGVYADLEYEYRGEGEKVSKYDAGSYTEAVAALLAPYVIAAYPGMTAAKRASHCKWLARRITDASILPHPITSVTLHES